MCNLHSVLIKQLSSAIVVRLCAWIASTAVGVAVAVAVAAAAIARPCNLCHSAVCEGTVVGVDASHPTAAAVGHAKLAVL